MVATRAIHQLKVPTKMKCSQCDKPAIGEFGPQNLALCIDCNLKLAQAQAIRQDNLERIMNYATDNMDAITGITEGSKKFPPRPKPVHIQGATFNNIRVQNSAIGMLNTGTIECIDSAITAISGSSDEAAARAIRELSEAIISDSCLSKEQKDQLLQMMSLISTEATAPHGARRGFAVRPVLQEMANLIAGSASLMELWDRVRPVLDRLF